MWRATPITLAGLLALIISLLLPRWFHLTRQQRLTSLYLGLFAILFTIFMTLGAKKFDRYLLPIFAPLICSPVWAGLRLPARYSDVFGERRRANAGRAKWLSAIGIAGLAGIIVLQALSAGSTYPYYFSYYNPLAGGPAKAPQVMMIGWGEGLDQAAPISER